METFAQEEFVETTISGGKTTIPLAGMETISTIAPHLWHITVVEKQQSRSPGWKR
jgi:hypothetical protein